MRKQVSDNREEKNFDTILKNSISELPPEIVVENVTPWKPAMNRVLIGFALNMLTLNFLCLDYILPAIGIVLTLLGFRSLRSENRYFRYCFLIAAVQTVYRLAALILNTTILPSMISAPWLWPILTIASLILQFAELLCFRSGLRTVQNKAELPPDSKSVTALIIWCAVVCALAVVQYSGLLINAGMVIGYIFIIRSLFHLSDELEKVGYAIRPQLVKITDRHLAVALACLLLIGCTLGYIFGNSYPMDWQAVNPEEHNEVENIKTSLAELGFPEYVLDDLTPEDIRACDGAMRVAVNVTEESFGSMNDKNMRITGVGVQLPGKRERWMIFHHFLWLENPGFYGTESIQLWPSYRNIPSGWGFGGTLSGRILYNSSGISYTAPYYSLGNQTFTSNSLFWGEQTSTDVFATFSMPVNGENYRGYIAYTMDEMRDGAIIDSWINYTHQLSFLQYPAQTAMEKRMTSWADDAMTFRTIQDALQFYPSDNDIRMLE